VARQNACLRVAASAKAGRAAVVLCVGSDRFGCPFLWFFLLGKQKK